MRQLNISNILKNVNRMGVLSRIFCKFREGVRKSSTCRTDTPIRTISVFSTEHSLLRLHYQTYFIATFIRFGVVTLFYQVAMEHVHFLFN